MKKQEALAIDDMRVVATQEGILKRIHQITEADDFYSEYVPTLLDFLEYDNAKPWLEDEVTREGWTQYNDKQLQYMLHHYMDNWWKQKVEDGRGLSVHRGRSQVVNLMFLAGIEAWKYIGLDNDEGMDGGWYQEDAYNAAADIFGLPHIEGYRE